jgi:hypothetical protein
MKQGNKEYSPWLGVVAHACNSNPQEAETEGSRVQDQPGLRSDNLLKKKTKALPEIFGIITNHYCPQTGRFC